ncbi:hypothetical protein D4764_08G0009650 [Takifugu flavidus]|uniref:Uncharacterized protein n=1 Tax=Takifugu flavidus TaxID=433684 RepID=A0A5C6MRJ4_9TELE|nr:hypothetical protein D4764_08G0009650 [Takifugu flavidus]
MPYFLQPETQGNKKELILTLHLGTIFSAIPIQPTIVSYGFLFL